MLGEQGQEVLVPFLQKPPSPFTPRRPTGPPCMSGSSQPVGWGYVMHAAYAQGGCCQGVGTGKYEGMEGGMITSAGCEGGRERGKEE